MHTDSITYIEQALHAHRSYFERARALLRTAQTDEEHRQARFAMQNASGEIQRWQERLTQAGAE